MKTMSAMSACPHCLLSPKRKRRFDLTDTAYLLGRNGVSASVGRQQKKVAFYWKIII